MPCRALKALFLDISPFLMRSRSKGSFTTIEALSLYGSRRPLRALIVVLSKTNSHLHVSKTSAKGWPQAGHLEIFMTHISFRKAFKPMVEKLFDCTQ